MFYEEKGKNSEGFWFPVDDAELFIPSEMPAADQGLKGQPFLTQELVAVAFENEWKKCMFGHVPDGFVVFVVDVSFCPCLDWVVLYFARAFDYFTRALDFSGHSEGVRLVLASRAAGSCHLLLLSAWYINLVKNKFGGFFCNKMCDSEECWGVQARHCTSRTLTYVPKIFCKSLKAILWLHCSTLLEGLLPNWV